MQKIDPYDFEDQYQRAEGYDAYQSAQMLMYEISQFQDQRMATEVALSQLNLQQQKRWQSIKRKISSLIQPNGTIDPSKVAGQLGDEYAYLKGGPVTYTKAGTVFTMTVEGVIESSYFSESEWSTTQVNYVTTAIQNELDRYDSQGTATTLRMQDITNKKNISTETWSSVQKAKQQLLQSIVRGIGGG